MGGTVERGPDSPDVRGEPPALVLNADSLSVRRALSMVLDRLADCDLTREELASVELVLAEVLNNIVEHAYGGRGAGEIQLWWTLGPTGLHVRISDAGVRMPEGWVPLMMARDPAEHAALVPEGGFGWFLITGLAHNIIYRREGGMNVLTFRMIVGAATRRSEEVGARV